jgi:hypothetical protein
MPKKKMPRSLFSKGLDSVATKWLKNTAPADDATINREVALAGLAAMEALLFAPRVSFKVYGENVVLALLTNALGARAVEDLLRAGDLEFVLWRSFPVRWSKEQLQPGLKPLAGLTLTDKAHSDPLESAELGLRGWGKPLASSDRQRLAKAAAERTVVVATDLGQKAVQRVEHAYESGLLAARGFKAEEEMASLSSERRSQLATLAEDLAEGVVAFEGDYDFHESAESWKVLVDACARVQGQSNVIESAESVLSLEGIPDVPTLIARGIVKHKDIVTIRRSPEAVEFRRWLWSQSDPADARSVGEAYLAAMAPKIDLKDQTWFKAARVSVMNIVGSVVGAALAGPLGGAAGFAVSTVAGLALSHLDAFWGDKLLAGTNPRRFATDVLAPAIAAHRAASAPWATRTDTAPAQAKPSAPVAKASIDGEARRKDRNKRKAKHREQRKARKR